MLNGTSWVQACLWVICCSTHLMTSRVDEQLVTFNAPTIVREFVRVTQNLRQIVVFWKKTEIYIAKVF